MAQRHSPPPSGRHMNLVSDPRFQRQIERIAAMGARVVAEAIIEAAGSEARAAALIDRYAGMDAGIVRALGADVFPPRPDLRSVSQRCVE